MYAPAGVHEPVDALNGEPTRAVPAIVGAVVLANTPGATAAVAGAVAELPVKPFLATLTRAVITLPTRAGPIARDFAVAPLMGTPLANHW